jgi:hypothetical protein
MIRKQLYIRESQERSLKEAARSLTITEAELVRRALDAFLATTGTDDPDDLASILREAERLAAGRTLPGGRFDRDELYERVR